MSTNKTRPAPPYADETKKKLKTRSGNFAFKQTQSGGLAFWCMLGVYKQRCVQETSLVNTEHGTLKCVVPSSLLYDHVRNPHCC